MFTNLNTRSKLLLGYGAPLSLMVIVSIGVYLGIQNLIESSRWVQHTQRVISHGQELSKLLIDMETGERGYLITGKDQFLEPYYNAERIWDQKVDELMALIVDNPAQRDRLETVRELELKWHKLAADVEISMRRQVNDNDVDAESLAKLIESGTGKRIIDQIRIELNEFILLEKALILQRKDSSDSVARNVIVLTVVGSVVTILFALLIAFLVSNNIVRRLHVVLSATIGLGKGGAFEKIVTNETDEIGVLSHSFNDMAAKIEQTLERETEAANELRAFNQQLNASQQQLKASNQQLMASQQQLQALNQQLTTKEQALIQSEIQINNKLTEMERFNNMMVGREIVMLELKEEVNALLEEKGETKKYNAPDEAKKIQQ